jgi:Protein of unknown function (DUF2892)
MLRNESPLDRGIRLVAAVVLLVLAFATGASSVMGIILIVLAAILLVTAVVGFCPLYRIFGIRTK